MNSAWKNMIMVLVDSEFYFNEPTVL